MIIAPAYFITLNWSLMPLNIQELEEERNKLREQLAEMSQRVESLDQDNVSSLAAK